MGRIQDFEKIEFKPFKIRKGQIEASNYYSDASGKIKSRQSHLERPKYSFWEILKWEENPYYGKEEKFRNDGYSDSGSEDFLSKGGHSIQKSFFIKEELCYMLANWENLDHDEFSPDLKFIGSRPLDLSSEERVVFMEIAEITQKEIEKQLLEFVNGRS